MSVWPWLAVLALWLNAALIWWTYAREDWPRLEPREDWHWGGDDYPKEVGWVRSLGPNDLQESEPTSVADSPS